MSLPIQPLISKQCTDSLELGHIPRHLKGCLNPQELGGRISFQNKFISCPMLSGKDLGKLQVANVQHILDWQQDRPIASGRGFQTALVPTGANVKECLLRNKLIAHHHTSPLFLIKAALITIILKQHMLPSSTKS